VTRALRSTIFNIGTEIQKGHGEHEEKREHGEEKIENGKKNNINRFFPFFNSFSVCSSSLRVLCVLPI
jgi:hypothetical protein